MSSKITLNKLIEELSDESLIPKIKSQEFINSLVETVLDEVNTKGKSAITNFGSFTVVDVAERTGVNPKTGEPLVIPAHKRISFTPYKALEKKVNRDFDHLEATVVDSTLKPEEPKAKEPETSTNETEELLDVLISEEKEEAVVDDPSSVEPKPDEENFDDDPFNLNDQVADNESTNEIELESSAELEEEPQNDNLEVIEDGTSDTHSFRTPGRPERSSNSISPTILIGILTVFVIGVFVVWFFFLRPDSAPTTASADTEDILNDPSAFENEQVLNEINDANQMTGDLAENDSESQIIPMIAADEDLSENPGEMMTIANQEPQIEYERFTGISFNVSSGVWIYEIARQTYGNTRLWPLIFQANYTLANNPDLILPNIELNIPQLEGTADDPTANDYLKLAEAARYVAKAYENAGNSEQSTAYILAADWYETMQ